MRAKLAEYVLGDMTLVYEIDSHGSKVVDHHSQPSAALGL